MGVDFQGLSRIIFFGLPHSILDVLEEIGRAGRDCENVVALLLYNYHRVHCEPVMRKLFQCNDCRGTRMMNSELENVKSYSGGCSCCDLFQNMLLWKLYSTSLEKLFSGTSTNVLNDGYVSKILILSQA